MSAHPSSIRTASTVSAASAFPPSKFEYIESHEEEMELVAQPRYIQQGKLPIRHKNTQRSVGNCQASNGAAMSSAFDYIDSSSMCIVVPPESVHSKSDQLVDSIRKTLQSIKRQPA